MSFSKTIALFFFYKKVSLAVTFELIILLTFSNYLYPETKGNQIRGYSVTKQALRAHTAALEIADFTVQVGQKSIPAGATAWLPFYVPILFLPRQKQEKLFEALQKTSSVQRCTEIVEELNQSNVATRHTQFFTLHTASIIKRQNKPSFQIYVNFRMKVSKRLANSMSSHRGHGY